MCCPKLKYKCLKGGGGAEELRRSTILGPPPYLCVYSICNRDSGFDGADIADYGLQIASFDGFIGISDPSGREQFPNPSKANLSGCFS